MVGGHWSSFGGSGWWTFASGSSVWRTIRPILVVVVAVVGGRLYNEWLEDICLWEKCLEDICPILGVAAVLGGHLYNEWLEDICLGP